MDKEYYQSLINTIFDAYLLNPEKKNNGGYNQVQEGKSLVNQWFENIGSNFTLDSLKQYLNSTRSNYQNTLLKSVGGTWLTNGWGTFLNNHLIPLIDLIDNDIEDQRLKKTQSDLTTTRYSLLCNLKANWDWDKSKGAEFSTRYLPLPPQHTSPISDMNTVYLADEIHTQESKLSELSQHNEELSSALELRIAEIDVLQEKLTQALTAQKTLETQQANLYQQLHTHTQTIDSQQKQLQSDAQRIDELLNQLQRQQEKYAATEKELLANIKLQAEKHKELADENDRYRTLASRYRQETHSLHQRLGEHVIDVNDNPSATGISLPTIVGSQFKPQTPLFDLEKSLRQLNRARTGSDLRKRPVSPHQDKF